MGAEDSWKQSRCRLVGAEQSCRWSKGFVGADGDKELWEQSTSPGEPHIIDNAKECKK